MNKDANANRLSLVVATKNSKSFTRGEVLTAKKLNEELVETVKKLRVPITPAGMIQRPDTC